MLVRDNEEEEAVHRWLEQQRPRDTSLAHWGLQNLIFFLIHSDFPDVEESNSVENKYGSFFWILSTQSKHPGVKQAMNLSLRPFILTLSSLFICLITIIPFYHFHQTTSEDACIDVSDFLCNKILPVRDLQH